MEPPRGVFSTLWNFICFLPFFVGLLLLGAIKGIILCPLICLLMVVGISGIILGLWPMHWFWTYYSILSAKQLGPILKFVLCFGALPVPLILWPVVGIVASIIGGAAYGFFSPILATFDAVGESKTNKLFHCFYDGTWDTVKGCCTVIRDFGDFCYHSYRSFMQDLRTKSPSNGEYEIRLLYLPGALIAGVLGIVVDVFMISFIAICKSPIMLYKGWSRLFHDLIGREGPFLETICVPFAGLIILLWPLAVVGSVLGSIASSLFLGAYAGIVAYQESSFLLGLRYIVTSLSIYDEYSNDVLDMQEGSCFPRLIYRRGDVQSSTDGLRTSTSISRASSFHDPPSRMNSLKEPMIDLKPLELFDSLFKECQHHGETMVYEGTITPNDIEDAKSSKGNKVISIGLPAFCILETLIRSAKANSAGLLLSDNVTEISSTNRPKDTFFDWFFNPLLIIKDQIRAENLSESEEEYLYKLVLLSGDPERLKNLTTVMPPESERRQAEIEALARRLRGITKSISRFPTFRRRFDSLVKRLSEELARKKGSYQSTNGSRTISRSRSAFGRLFSQKSSNGKTSYRGSDKESQPDERDVEIG